MKGDFILPSLLQQAVVFDACRKGFGLLAQAPCLVGEALRQCFGLFETAPLKPARSFPFEEGGSATGRSLHRQMQKLCS